MLIASWQFIQIAHLLVYIFLALTLEPSLYSRRLVRFTNYNIYIYIYIYIYLFIYAKTLYDYS